MPLAFPLHGVDSPPGHRDVTLNVEPHFPPLRTEWRLETLAAPTTGQKERLEAGPRNPLGKASSLPPHPNVLGSYGFLSEINALK